MKTFIIGLIGLVVAGCSSYNPSGCPGSEIDCYGKCFDPNYFSCKEGKVVRVSCDTNYHMCNGNCISILADCCSNGSYCMEQFCSSNNTCRPVTAEDCGGGRYCIFPHTCINQSSCT